MQPDPATDRTKWRLLHAAGDEFARSGFKGASTRAICEAADANVSAIKYHFGSKEDLYLAVWETAVNQLVTAETMPRLGDLDTPQDDLRAFIAWFMRLVLIDSQTHPWAGPLMAHETMQPTERSLDVFIKGCAGPIRDEMSRIVRSVIDRPVGKKTMDNLVFAVIALCVNPKHSCKIMTRFGHPPPNTRASVNRFARTMADFAIGGLNSFAIEEDD